MIRIATDGSCIQQGGFRQGDETPRPGAYGLVADIGGGTIEQVAVPSPNGMIGGMEVSGLLLALEYVRDLPAALRDRPVLIQCDAQYVVKGFNEWMDGWKAKRWRGSKGPVAYPDLWERILDLRDELGARVPTVQWVKAHQNVGGLNDRVDSLVNTCARTQRGVDTRTPTTAAPSDVVASSGGPAEDPAATLDRIVGAFAQAKPVEIDLGPRDGADLGPPWEDTPPVGSGGTTFRPVLPVDMADVLRDLVKAADADADLPEPIRALAERARALLA